jgi:hypothetical protein
MKIRAHRSNGLNIPATIHTANLPKDTVVAISGDKTVDKAGAGAIPLGFVFKPARSADGSGTIETSFHALIEVKGSGAIAAGDRVKLAAVDGTTGETVVAKWVSQTDAAAGDKPDTLFGVCWKGGADGATLEVLVY